MAERRLRTAQKKKRARRRFWEAHGEKVQLAAIGLVVVTVCYFIFKAMLH